MSFAGRIDAALQRLAERATRLVPPPLSSSLLARWRRQKIDEFFEERRYDLPRAHELYERDRAAGLRAIAALAEDAVAALRAIPGGGVTLASIAGRLDAVMPTAAQEHIDDPSFPEADRTRVLGTLDRLNRRFGTYVRFLDALAPLLDEEREVTLLDLASGHGGFAIAIARLAEQRGLRMRVIATDLREEYMALGRRRAEAVGARLEFRVVDALHLEEHFRAGEVDVVTCTQSLHHFGAGMVAALIAESLRIAPRLFFVDPMRSLSRLVVLGVGSSLGTLDPVFVHDAVLSLRRSFVPEELEAIARCAPGGERLAAFYLPPGFAALRS